MAVTNPTKHVTVRRLNRFKQQIDLRYATKTELQQMRSDVIEAAAEAATEAAAAAVVVATESNIRNIVSGYLA